MSNIEKLAVPSVLIIVGLVAYLFLKKEIYKNLAIFFSSFMIGTLFAVYGQVYQTGADVWILFRNWAIFLIIPMVVTGYYSLMILFSIVTAISTGFYLDLYLSGDIVPFLSSLIFGIILIVYPFLQKSFKFKFNNIFYNTMIGIFYICFMVSGSIAINANDYGFIAIILYLAFVGVVYLVAYGQLKKITVKVLSITALGVFGVAFIMKMIKNIFFADITVYILLSLLVIIGTIAGVVKSVSKLENENIKKFTNLVVGFLKILAFFLLIALVFSLLSSMGLEEGALIVVSIILIIFSYFAARMLKFEKDKLEIVAFIAGLICLGGYLRFYLEMKSLTVLLIVTIIYDVFWFTMPTRALDLLLLPLHYFLLGDFLIEKLEYVDYYYIIIFVALIIEGYFIYNKKLLSNEKIKRILCGNEFTLLVMSTVFYYTMGAATFLIAEVIDLPSYARYYNVVLVVFTAIIGLFIIFKEIKNPTLKIVLSLMLIALNYFAYSETLSLAITLLLMLVYAFRESKWGLAVSTLATVYVIFAYYISFYKTLLDKSIALSISGGLLLVAYLVLKYGFKGVEDNE
ncbi:Permease [Fusobacterium nucleatum subsp. nucleatum ATCC 25586]|nr:Permease [Fusobacterium nucleatum subsp. nucleatum ATCC 25586]